MKQTKKKTTINSLNKLIDERIKELLPHLIKEAVDTAVSVVLEQTSKESHSQIKESSDTPLMDILQSQGNGEVRKQPTQKNTIKTGNPALDAVLNETAGGLPTGNTSSEYRNLMNKEMFTSNDMGAFPSVKQKTVDTMRGNHGATIDSSSTVGKAIDAAMNRDYSELVKRFKK